MPTTRYFKRGGLFLLVLMGLALLLAACGDSTATTAPATTAAASTTAAAATTAAASATTAAAAATTAQVAATTAAAASGGAATAPGKPGGTLKVALNAELGKLDPAFSGQFVERQVFYNMYDSLVAADPNLKIVPALAESWEISADGKTYTFKLRKGVKFHDGTDFNADAVKFNMERYKTADGSVRKSDLDSVETIEVVDPYTVKFNLKSPNAPLLATLVDRAGMILSPDVIKKLGADLQRAPVNAGTGPFKFIEWKKDDHLTLERNPNYWKKDSAGTQLPYLDKIIYRPIVDDTVRLTNLKTGDIDVIDTVPAQNVADLKNDSAVNYKDISSTAYAGFRLNVAAEPFNNKALRQAIGYALDTQSIFKTVFFGVGAVSNGPIPPSSWAFDPNFKPYTHDIAKAKAKLAEGGKPGGFSFKMQIQAGSPVTQQEAELIRDQLSEAGITVELEQLEFAKIVENTTKHTFTSALIGWSGRIDPDGNMYAHFKTGGSNNDSQYSNPQVDALLDKARATSNQDERKAAYQEAQKIIMDELPYPLINHGASFMATTKKVQNFLLMPDAIMRFTEVSLK